MGNTTQTIFIIHIKVGTGTSFMNWIFRSVNIYRNWLVVRNMNFWFSIQLGMSSSQLTHILQRSRFNHQCSPVAVRPVAVGSVGAAPRRKTRMATASNRTARANASRPGVPTTPPWQRLKPISHLGVEGSWGMAHGKHQRAVTNSHSFEKHATCMKHMSCIGHVLETGWHYP